MNDERGNFRLMLTRFLVTICPSAQFSPIHNCLSLRVPNGHYHRMWLRCCQAMHNSASDVPSLHGTVDDRWTRSSHGIERTLACSSLLVARSQHPERTMLPSGCAAVDTHNLSRLFVSIVSQPPSWRPRHSMSTAQPILVPQQTLVSQQPTSRKSTSHTVPLFPAERCYTPIQATPAT